MGRRCEQSPSSTVKTGRQKLGSGPSKLTWELTNSMVVDVVIIWRIAVGTRRVEDDGDDLKRFHEGLHEHEARSNDKFQD